MDLIDRTAFDLELQSLELQSLELQSLELQSVPGPNFENPAEPVN